MQLAETTTANTAVARPLHVLVPLIKQDLKDAQEAGMPYYRAAGEKMIEAKTQMKHGEFQPWINRHFGLSKQHAARYMSLAAATSGEQKSRMRDFSSIREFERVTGNTQQGNGRTVWHEPVKEALGKVNVDRMAQELTDRKTERDLEYKLALQLIDIGYKALATKLHPDKGGSRDAMARLNHVRDRLKQHA